MIIDIKIEGNFSNFDEVILKMSELIKDGYTVTTIEQTKVNFTMCKDTINRESAYEITLHNKLADNSFRRI